MKITNLNAPIRIANDKIFIGEEAVVKHPGGHPTLYREEYCLDIIEFRAKGYGIEAYAGKLGVSKDTIYEWIKVHPRFSDANKIAESRCQLFWESMGIQGTAGKLDHFNDRSWKFNMQNRFRWKDRTDMTTDDEKVEAPLVYIPREEKPDDND